MVTKITFLIIVFYFSTVHIHAQSSKRLQLQTIRLLENIKANLNKIDNLLSNDCKSKLLKAPKGFESNDTINLSNRSVAELQKAIELFESYKSPDSSCINKNKKIRRLNDSTKVLIKSLRTINHGGLKSESIKLVVKVVDDSTGKHINSTVTIFPADSANRVRVLLKDSQINPTAFYTFLSPNKTYFLKVEDSSYTAYTEQMNINRDSIKVIRLKRAVYDTNVNRRANATVTPSNPQEKSKFQKFVKEHLSFIIGILGLIFLAFIGVVLSTIKLRKRHIQSARENKFNVQTIAELEESIKIKNEVIDSLNNELLAAKDSCEEIVKEQPEVVAAEQGQQLLQHETKRNFICEILMTAGPRKKFMNEPDADKDLGEDVCGFVSDMREVLFWVLDGTSDQYCLKNPSDNREYFSSRLLAQLLSQRLRKSFTEKQEKEFEEIILGAIEGAKEDFLEQINQLPSEEKRILEKNIGNKNLPECATTILIARLSLNGNFIGYRSGDSKLFLFRVMPESEIEQVETTLETKNDKSNDRLFFKIMLDENKKFYIFSNNPLDHEIIEEKNITTAISFSDGIGMNTEFLLKDEYKKNPQETRKEIMYQLQGTGDDKTICFIEIKETTEAYPLNS
jgi:hypothetical protein